MSQDLKSEKNQLWEEHFSRVELVQKPKVAKSLMRARNKGRLGEQWKE